MLFLLITTLVLPIGSALKCYSCPREENIFNYTVTSDRFPSEFNGCSTKDRSSVCSANIRWDRNPSSSEFWFENSNDAVTNAFMVSVFSANENRQGRRWISSISYYCSTYDECNSPNELKRIIRSLTINPDYDSLESLLVSQTSQPTRATCFSLLNSTAFQCETDTSECEQCKTIVSTAADGQLHVCASCSPMYDMDEDIAGTTLMFSLDGRNRTQSNVIYCRASQCNSLQNIKRLQQATNINFDVDKFTSAATTTWKYFELLTVLLLLLGMFIAV